jgi:hypothetical protein
MHINRFYVAAGMTLKDIIQGYDTTGAGLNQFSCVKFMKIQMFIVLCGGFCPR